MCRSGNYRLSMFTMDELAFNAFFHVNWGTFRFYSAMLMLVNPGCNFVSSCFSLHILQLS